MVSLRTVRSLLLSSVVAGGLIVTCAAQNNGAGADAKPADKQASPATKQEDPLKRQLSPKEEKARQKALYKELEQTYKVWLDQEVVYIISPEERSAFLKLTNDEERDQFIEQFWLRRDPTPDTIENEYKDEHYRRIAYANERFAAGVPGWKTDRGRMYIVFGPADEIESHPSGGTYQRPMDEGGGSTSTFPFETWRYRHIENIGQEVIVEFVDPCMCGEYHMTMDPQEKDALKMVPGAGLTFWESIGMASKIDRVTGTGAGMQGNVSPLQREDSSKYFDKMQQFYALQRPPEVKFKDLKTIVDTKIRYNFMPFDVRFDFVRLTSESSLVPITIQIKNRDITFQNKDGVQKGVVNIFGRVSTLTGRIVQTFEDTVMVQQPAELLPKVLDSTNLYWKAIPLRANMYRLDVVVKDVNGDRVGTYSKGIKVPEYSEDKLATSSLIVADQMERVAKQNVGAGSFVIGQTKVRPRVDLANGKLLPFKRTQRANFWMQVYGLTVDQKTKKPSAAVEYDVVNIASNKSVVHLVESTDQMASIGGDQLTLEKSLPLQSLEPGLYRVEIKVTDNLSKQTITQPAKFAVE